MSLKFSGKKAIQFGELKVYPKTTAELRLRLRDITLTTEDGIREAIETLSSFFPEHKTEVKQFMAEQMETYELNKLVTYLVGGEDAVGMANRAMQDELAEVIRKANDV